jgi:hypothetical protein
MNNLYNRPLFNEVMPGTQDAGLLAPGFTRVPMENAPQVNSTTYIDLLGVLVGLDRLPGEPADVFADRLYKAASLDRGVDYVGLMNALTLELGLELSELISLERIPADETDTDLTCAVSVDLAGVHIEWGDTRLTSPLMTVGPDDFWQWRLLSDVVADLNNARGLQASLLGVDGPAFQLARQSSVLLAVGEAIDGQTVRLAHPGLVAGTETFNQPVPQYAVESDSVLFFNDPLRAGTRVNYQYRVYPYSLIGSPVFLMSMLDPLLGTLAVSTNGTLIYQMKEFAQELVANDRSYWAA